VPSPKDARDVSLGDSERMPPQTDPAIPADDAPATPVETNSQRNDWTRLIRASLLLLVLLATGIGAVSWNKLREFSAHLELIPVFLFLVICCFAVFVYLRTREMADLRSVVRGLHDQQSVLSSEVEAQKLLATVTASRESFRDLIDSFDSAVFTLSLDGKIRAANKAFTKSVGKTFQDVIGKPIYDFISSPTAEEMEQGLATFVERRTWSGLTRVGISTTKQWRYFECTLHPVLQDGNVLAVTVIADDVTAEREREALFTAFFETLQEPVWIATCEGEVIDGNQALASLLGFQQRSELLRQNLKECVLDPERERMAELMRCREVVRDLEITLARSDGSRAVCIVSATPVVDLSGTARYHGTFTDVTQRRLVERRLLSEQRFREHLINSFPDAVITLDRAGRFSYVSGLAERMFGHDSAELLNQHIADYFDQQDSMPLQTLLHDCVLDVHTVCSRELHLRASSAERWKTVQVRATALQEEPGDAIGIVASLRDVTDQKRMEEQLIARERMAAVGQMIEGFSHELNNPLTSMLGACDLLRQEELSATATRNLALLEGETSRAREIVQNLMLFSRPATEAIAVVDVEKLIEKTAALRRHSLRAKGVSVDLALREGMPLALGAPGQLMQVFLNLLMNAEDASVSGGRTGGSIRIRVGSDDHFVWATFQDDGPGIPASDIHRIFEPFFTTKGPRGGAGLGLSICKSIIEAHAGKVEVASSMDGGAIFRVSLPRAAQQMPADPSGTEPGRRADS